MSNSIFKFVQINMKHLLYLWRNRHIAGQQGQDVTLPGPNKIPFQNERTICINDVVRTLKKLRTSKGDYCTKQ